MMSTAVNPRAADARQRDLSFGPSVAASKVKCPAEQEIAVQMSKTYSARAIANYLLEHRVEFEWKGHPDVGPQARLRRSWVAPCPKKGSRLMHTDTEL